MKIKWIIIIGIAIVVAAGAGVGGFFGGRAYERSQANNVRNDFLQARGVGGFTPGAGANANGTQIRGFGGGAFGTVKSIDGNTFTLTTAQSEVKVTLSDTTTFEKTTAGTSADLQAGQDVTVAGQRDANGNITAAQVTILPAGSVQAPSGTTP